jgi:tetratricopeptide (TPR) repeat protein
MFFDRFRDALSRLPAGLIRAAPPATAAALAAAEARLGRALPEAYASFLRSFDGADLFHEAVVVAGVDAEAPHALVALNDPDDDAATARAGELTFAEAIAGDRFALDVDGRVIRLRAGSDERAVAGSTFERWLDAVVARERILYDADGEFAEDVFDDDGEELRPLIVLRQAERALKADPGAAEAHHERGVALRRLGRGDEALDAFAAATTLDPGNPWPWFDLGRAALDAGRDPARALDAFREAAARESGPSGARLLAWAARAADTLRDDAAATEARAAALARDPSLIEALLRAEAQARLEDDDEARAENEALRLALAPGSQPRRALPVVTMATTTTEEPAPRRPPARPPRPDRAAPPRSAASPPASRPSPTKRGRR